MTTVTVTRCVRCGSDAVVALTYARVDGQPRQAGLCAACTSQVAYVDRLAPIAPPPEEGTC